MKEIPLTKGAVAIVDDDMYEYLNQFHWYLNTEGYAIRETWKPKTRIRMHREILGTPPGMDTDHINNNRLDNRRENLRVCTRTQNLQNSSLRSDSTSGYKGVSWFKPAKMWKAQIKIGKRVIAKYFKTPLEAAKAYNEMATEYFGKFAKLNEIP